MPRIGEYARYLIATAMLCNGVLGLYLGGAWVWLGLAGFVSLALLDFTAGADHSLRGGPGKWFHNGVLYLQLPLMVALWVLFALHIRAGDLGWFNMIGALIAVAFLSALGGLPSAHELMHRKHPLEIAYCSLYLTVFGLPMNDLYHVHGHHPFVGTPDDSDTPLRGQSVYRFVWHSIVDGTIKAYRFEKARLAKRDHSVWWWRSRVVWALISEAVWIGGFVWLAGPAGLPWLLATWAVCFLILGGFNYTQHYGIVRQPGTPLLPHHSWNHLNTFSRAVSFEISTHSEHHLNPDKHYELLRPYTQAPQMPSIVACFLASFLPPLWERVIAKPRLENWDRHFASPAEQRLAMAANARAGWPQWLHTAPAA